MISEGSRDTDRLKKKLNAAIKGPNTKKAR